MSIYVNAKRYYVHLNKIYERWAKKAYYLEGNIAFVNLSEDYTCNLLAWGSSWLKQLYTYNILPEKCM